MMRAIYIFLFFSGVCFADAPLRTFEGAPLESADSATEGTFGKDGVFCEDCWARWAESELGMPPADAKRRAREIASRAGKNNGTVPGSTK